MAMTTTVRSLQKRVPATCLLGPLYRLILPQSSLDMVSNLF